MKNITALTLGVGLALGVLPPAIVRGEPTGNVTTIPAKKSPTVGKVAVLDNDNTLSGDVERIGDQVRIKKLAGETWLPAAKVTHICASMADAYAYLRGRANLGDPYEMERLSLWCHQHGLREQALADARAALRLDPDSIKFRRLVEHRTASTIPPAPVVAKPPEDKGGPRVEVPAEALNQFAVKVHPILMNACVRCHTGGNGGNFQLVQISGPALSSRRSLEKNLAAVVAHLTPGDPTGMRFLNKTVSLHGPNMATAPLRNKQAVAFKTLESWFAQVAEAMPQPAVTATTAATALPSPAARAEVTPTMSNFGGDRSSPTPATPVPPTPTPIPPLPVRPTPGVPTTPTPPAAGPKKPLPAEEDDPVAPGPFNRQGGGMTP